MGLSRKSKPEIMPTQYHMAWVEHSPTETPEALGATKMSKKCGAEIEEKGKQSDL